MSQNECGGCLLFARRNGWAFQASWRLDEAVKHPLVPGAVIVCGQGICVVTSAYYEIQTLDSPRAQSSRAVCVVCEVAWWTVASGPLVEFDLAGKPPMSITELGDELRR